MLTATRYECGNGCKGLGVARAVMRISVHIMLSNDELVDLSVLGDAGPLYRQDYIIFPYLSLHDDSSCELIAGPCLWSVRVTSNHCTCARRSYPRTFSSNPLSRLARRKTVRHYWRGIKHLIRPEEAYRCGGLMQIALIKQH